MPLIKKSARYQRKKNPPKDAGNIIRVALEWIAKLKNNPISAAQIEHHESFNLIPRPDHFVRQHYVTANEIADYYGLGQKKYRQSLRDRGSHDPRLFFHHHNAPWKVEAGTPEYEAMIEVAEKLALAKAGLVVIPALK